MSSTTELAERTGATYRQIDYWINTGLIPGMNGDDANPGSGFARDVTAAQLDHFRVMVALVNDGVKPATAARLALALASHSRCGPSPSTPHPVAWQAA